MKTRVTHVVAAGLVAVGLGAVILAAQSADTAAAHPIAQRILERVASVRVEGYGQPIGLTCSIGVATSDMLGVWGEHLIAQADAAVYQAKRSGRNRVQVAMAA